MLSSIVNREVCIAVRSQLVVAFSQGGTHMFWIGVLRLGVRTICPKK